MTRPSTPTARSAASTSLVRIQDRVLAPALFRRLARAVIALGDEGLARTYQTTFWFDLREAAALPEEAILALLPHLPRSPITGVEWWLSRMRPTDVQVDFHQDRDERRFQRTGATAHPAFGSVFFLNRCRGGLLAVTRAPACERNAARAPDDLAALDLVRPWPNRLASFPGAATHGVLDANGQIPHVRLHPPAPLRLAVVVNGWTRRPEGVPRFAEARTYRSLARARAGTSLRSSG